MKEEAMKLHFYPFAGLLRAFMILVFFASNAGLIKAVPSYARQTGMACIACHTSFPELNAFGRQFKLNGYTLTTQKNIEAANDSGRVRLSLSPFAPLSGMVMTSFTHLNKTLPATQNNNIEFPQQLSLFYAGQITPHIGTFIQLTYDAQGGAIGLDNTDIRYSNHAQLGSKDWIYGFTLNNNPSVQDVWNTVPAWSYPYSSTGVGPHPMAATLVEGGLAGEVAGLGTYGLFNNLVYYEFSLYRSAPQGAVNPPDSTSSNTIKGMTPYWRLALEHQFGSSYLMLGTFGLSSQLYPTAPSGLYDKYTDLGIDLQYELALPKANISLHSSLVQESRTLNSTFASGGAANASSKLSSFKIDGNLYLQRGIGFTLGYFGIKGDADGGLYAPADINGSINGKPDSNGLLAEISFLPWYNTKFSLQYVKYSKFNGGSDNYDGSGRNAADNNNLYVLLWISF